MMQNKPLTCPVIGITGNSGSGKSTAAALLIEYGGVVIDADALSHAVIKHGQPAYADIVAHFSPSVLAEDGEIDRSKLGEAVFGQPEQLRALEAMIHPHVINRTLEIIRQIEQGLRDGTFAVIDAPLLIEAGMHQYCGSVWLVTAPDQIKENRIMERDSITREAAQKRLCSQPGDSLRAEHADMIIDNNDEPNCLAGKVRDAFVLTAEKLGI